MITIFIFIEVKKKHIIYFNTFVVPLHWDVCTRNFRFVEYPYKFHVIHDSRKYRISRNYIHVLPGPFENFKFKTTHTSYTY